MPSPPRVYVFFDYGCAYSYVGLRRVERLDRRLDVEWVWVPWEMYPSIGEEGDPIDGVDEPATHPVEGRPGKLADELGETLYWPPRAPNTELALRGALVAHRLDTEAFHAYHEAVFEAVWREGLNIGDADVLEEVVEGAGLDAHTVLDRVHEGAIDAALERASAAVERLALTRRPTFVFGDQRIVGTEAFERSMAKPLEAFVDRWKTDGPGAVVGLEDDLGLAELVLA